MYVIERRSKVRPQWQPCGFAMKQAATCQAIIDSRKDNRADDRLEVQWRIRPVTEH